jgi:hypothetical protein
MQKLGDLLEMGRVARRRPIFELCDLCLPAMRFCIPAVP